MSPAHAERFSRNASQASRAAASYMAGNCLTSLISGVAVLTTLVILRVPFPFLWALWGRTCRLLADGLRAENHVLNPVVMGQTVRVSPLFVLVSVLVGASIGGWLG